MSYRLPVQQACLVLVIIFDKGQLTRFFQKGFVKRKCVFEHGKCADSDYPACPHSPTGVFALLQRVADSESTYQTVRQTL